MIGYIGANELEHALSSFLTLVFDQYARSDGSVTAGMVADDPGADVYFHTTDDRRDINSSSLSSLLEADDGLDPFDFSVYMDQVSCTISNLHHIIKRFFVSRLP